MLQRVQDREAYKELGGGNWNTAVHRVGTEKHGEICAYQTNKTHPFF
jgi:hypothetical protein